VSGASLVAGGLVAVVAWWGVTPIGRFTRQREREIMCVCWMTGGAYGVPDAEDA
jgi:hypothetical protein